MLDREKYHQRPIQEQETKSARIRLARNQVYSSLIGTDGNDHLIYEVGETMFWERFYNHGAYRISSRIENEGTPVNPDATIVIVKTITAAPQKIVIIFPATETPYYVDGSLIELPHDWLPDKKSVPTDPDVIQHVIEERKVQKFPVTDLQVAELMMLGRRLQVRLNSGDGRANTH